MLSLVYVSSARQLFSENDLEVLLQLSRDNNTHLGLTGMLLYKDGNFMQVLEGPNEALISLYAKIHRDPRHYGVLELMRQQIEEREFALWSMGFTNLKDVNLQQMPGYSPFLSEPLNAAGFRADPTRAQKLLGMFRRKM
jgi:lipopolysaccharide biosynthesis regulator YciM